MKMGYDPSVPNHLIKVHFYYEYDAKLIYGMRNSRLKKLDFGKYICVMQSSLTLNDIEACLRRLNREDKAQNSFLGAFIE